MSFDFNTGAIDRASWVTALKAGDTAGARSRLMLWAKAGGRALAGLVNRRDAESRLIFEGDYGAGASATARAVPTAELRALQSDLATLGYYKSAVDGLAGSVTKAAIVAYQRSHPDLVADGLAGPATRASITRDVALRRRVGEAAGAAVGGAATAGGLAAAGGSGSPFMIALIVGATILAVVIGMVVFRYGGEAARVLTARRGQ